MSGASDGPLMPLIQTFHQVQLETPRYEPSKALSAREAVLLLCIMFPAVIMSIASIMTRVVDDAGTNDDKEVSLQQAPSQILLS